MTELDQIEVTPNGRVSDTVKDQWRASIERHQRLVSPMMGVANGDAR
jgi:hypothetical protein